MKQKDTQSNEPAAVHGLLGDAWALSRPGSPAALAATIASGMALSAGAGMRTLEIPKTTLKIRTMMAPVVLVGGLVGATWAEAGGAAWGLAVTSLVGSVVMWLGFRRLLSERRVGHA